MEIELAVTGPAAAGGCSPGVSSVKEHPEYPELSDACNRTGTPRVSSKIQRGFKTLQTEPCKKSRDISSLGICIVSHCEPKKERL